MSRVKGVKSSIQMPHAHTSDADWKTMKQIHQIMDRTIPNISGYFQSGMRKVAFATLTNYLGHWPSEEQVVACMTSVSFQMLVEDVMREKYRER
jgi:Fic family protein